MGTEVAGDPVPIQVRPGELGAIRYGADGLVAAVVQDATSKEVLMVAWMNEEALSLTLRTGRSWFFSRSRQELWCKGETSGDRQFVREARYDCDADAILLLVDQHGRGACHTGERSCFYRSFGSATAASGELRR
ncbi:MAG TPA: phosphoribosyl-AMP cyclohydrolase [Acidimicrobiales bacterium]|nr:phosphoribosyl-AMP cyclohydrolase [Acidimicrobiales bacterium]